MTESSVDEVRGYQRPRIFHLPDVPSNEERNAFGLPELGAMGREIKDLANVAGLVLDDWQAWCIENACEVRNESYHNPFTKRREPKWAAFEVGLVVGRQAGKGSILEARELAGLFLFGERLILHTAHLFDTSLEAFNRIVFLIQNTPELDAKVAKISNTHGSEGITLKNKQRLLFKARTGKAGRGFTGDCLIWDEAMFLSDQTVGAQMPLLSARPNSQIWYAGSAGMKESAQFSRVRNRAIKASKGSGARQPRLFFAEWSINPHSEFCEETCTEHDRSKRVDLTQNPEIQALQRAQLHQSYARANPAVGTRMTIEHIELEHESMDPEEFDRERLGIGQWPGDGEEWLVISEEAWSRQADQNSLIDGEIVLGIEVSPDKRYASIAAAGANDDGMRHVEVTGEGNVYHHRPGVGWIMPAIESLIQEQWPIAVAINKASFASSLKDDLVALGLNVVELGTHDCAQACGDFRAAFSPQPGESPTAVHIGQPPLTRAVSGSERRDLAEMWGWDKRNAATDISPLCAATWALWAYQKLTQDAEEPWLMYM